MAEPDWEKNWTNYRKHRKATLKQFHDGTAKSWSAQDASHAQYNPAWLHTDEQIKELELDCIATGTAIRSSDKKRTFYKEATDYVGYCCGTLTKFVFVEWLKSGGSIHGRPICQKTLETMGVKK